jgi:hypothetical protein
MRSDKPADGPGDATSAQRAEVAERKHTRDERGRLADDRDRRAGKREAVADSRERGANERESLADERERAADEREAEADRREALLNDRQRRLDERERKLAERGRALGVVVETLGQHTLDAIERSRALLALSGQALDRREAEVRREDALSERQQADVDRAAAAGEREQAAAPPDPREQISRARVLRNQAVTAMEAFVANEEEIARIHEELAAKRPQYRDRYLPIAEQARMSAEKARRVLRTFGG